VGSSRYRLVVVWPALGLLLTGDGNWSSAAAGVRGRGRRAQSGQALRNCGLIDRPGRLLTVRRWGDDLIEITMAMLVFSPGGNTVVQLWSSSAADAQAQP